MKSRRVLALALLCALTIGVSGLERDTPRNPIERVVVKVLKFFGVQTDDDLTPPKP